MKDVAECAFAETSEVASAALEFALEGGGECPFVETSKPAHSTLEGTMQGSDECTLVQREAFLEKSKTADGTVSEGSMGPLNEDSASPRKEGQRRRGSPQRGQREPPSTATLEGAMKDFAECAFAETSEVAGATLEFALEGGGEWEERVEEQC